MGNLAEVLEKPLNFKRLLKNAPSIYLLFIFIPGSVLNIPHILRSVVLTSTLKETGLMSLFYKKQVYRLGNLLKNTASRNPNSDTHSTTIV